jgi:hypothetical protein
MPDLVPGIPTVMAKLCKFDRDARPFPIGHFYRKRRDEASNSAGRRGADAIFRAMSGINAGFRTSNMTPVDIGDEQNRSVGDPR